MLFKFAFTRSRLRNALVYYSHAMHDEPLEWNMYLKSSNYEKELSDFRFLYYSLLKSEKA